MVVVRLGLGWDRGGHQVGRRSGHRGAKYYKKMRRQKSENERTKERKLRLPAAEQRKTGRGQSPKRRSRAETRISQFGDDEGCCTAIMVERLAGVLAFGWGEIWRLVWPLQSPKGGRASWSRPGPELSGAAGCALPDGSPIAGCWRTTNRPLMPSERAMGGCGF